MQWGYAPFLYFVAVLGLEAAMQKECRIIEALQNKLTYQQRLQYMKHYFPINYTVNVQFEEVLRAANITRLRDQNVGELSLRYLWLSVNSQVLLKIWAVLLEKHPSWEYTQDLCHLFEQLAEEYENYNQLLSAKPRGSFMAQPPRAGLAMSKLRQPPQVPDWGGSGGATRTQSVENGVCCWCICILSARDAQRGGRAVLEGGEHKRQNRTGRQEKRGEGITESSRSCRER
ncbi:interleukin-34 isoform X1 [Dermochelys coriacea]|uniref:interleukin-34 isoform X1 n=1 Tax=Dermochelys coriacea TaxID=27794 RepID=UPI0018E83916|nr:interleukin-34 isoform X1 [Dermochelys coriacea]XP_038223770.1 interleukin-34 isoform X1 [Dermochelys coriacea]XP_038223771.1 interleukin-34 isoform X1 [Dermochelys coriacea]